MRSGQIILAAMGLIGVITTLVIHEKFSRPHISSQQLPIQSQELKVRRNFESRQSENWKFPNGTANGLIYPTGHEEEDKRLHTKIKAITDSAKAGPISGSTRVAVFYADTPGLGNQLYGALSTALYGLLTSRSIKV